MIETKPSDFYKFMTFLLPLFHSIHDGSIQTLAFQIRGIYNVDIGFVNFP